MLKRFDLDPATRFKVFNLTLASANTEFSQIIERMTRQISIQCREDVDIKFSMTAGQIAGGVWQTIKAGSEKFLETIVLAEQQTLYFETESTDSPVVEIEVWQ